MATQSSASMTVTQQLVAKIEPKDTEGNPTDPNTVVWTSSDESIAVVVPQPGGLQANIIAGNVGSCKVVVNANAVKGGKGARPVLGILNLTVTSGDVAEVKIVNGERRLSRVQHRIRDYRADRRGQARDCREASRELTIRFQDSRTSRQPEYRPTWRVSLCRKDHRTDRIRDCRQARHRRSRLTHRDRISGNKCTSSQPTRYRNSHKMKTLRHASRSENGRRVLFWLSI